ncbi:MAG TPA: 16S rRNA (uracil(1498)-N(3))-methyltransferase [Pyrinomonadaceae bacterium]|nr:16S rRNA (uracil(1498)-N(3))-methyltransferase [Pyrinomonadaceae bacterium]
MTRRRFYASPSDFNSPRESVTLAVDEARYLREVLRLKVGDEVYVFNGEGKEFQCRIEESRKDSASLKIITEVEPARPESPLNLTLALALLKGEKFDLVVQKTTELGASRIIPVITKLADIRLRDTSDAAKRVSRWQRIALEAAKQSGRAVVPTVEEPTTFDSVVRSSEPGAVLFSERGGLPLRALKETISSPTTLTALIGSEGGWTDQELELARNTGLPIITLGGRILRAETAAITVATLLQHLFGDLR